ncbi:MAG: M23 family metallopeptidase [Clostridia bacterium]|nr:M23 family metallopeptidase [Clostridia bacterium]
MGENSGKFKMHTSFRPEFEISDQKKAGIFSKSRKTDIRQPEKNAARAPKTEYVRKRPPASVRLLRNTAVACSLLLAVMSLKNIDSPVTNRITGAVKNVLSMDLNLDDSIGKLSFVQNFMPESAQVFLNMNNRDQKRYPVSGQIVHEWSEKQPWIEYLTENSEQVYAVTGGTVKASVKSDDGDYTVVIEGEDGAEAVYAYLASGSVKAGSKVDAGDVIGISGNDAKAHLYFEYRVNEKSADPTKLLAKSES